MEIVNIMIGGVGGQGLVMTTDIISTAAYLDGHDVASSDVIGLAQRGGKIYGSVRYGPKVSTPNIPDRSVDVLVGLEELETLRYLDKVKPKGTVIMNRKKIMPNPVIMEKASYPEDIEETIRRLGFHLIALDTDGEAKNLGNKRVANTILLGVLSQVIPISEASFKNAILQKVPSQTAEANLKAFDYGRTLGTT